MNEAAYTNHREDRPFVYLSFGAGVQSSWLLVMSALGLYGCPKADVALFADTGDEPAWVYSHLEYMTAWAAARGLPVHVVRRNEARMSDDLRSRIEGTKSRFAGIPAFTSTNGQRGILRRQCTREYKIEPLQKAVRQLLGVKFRCRVRRPVICMQGISTDEAGRAKPARDKWVTATFPLLDAGLSRLDCLRLLAEYGLPTPKKSACVYCPFRSDREWLDLKTNDPDGFQHAIEVDRLIRGATKVGINNPVYIHSSLKPLENIDFTDYQGRLDFDRDHFGNACGGECGV